MLPFAVCFFYGFFCFVCVRECAIVKNQITSDKMLRWNRANFIFARFDLYLLAGGVFRLIGNRWVSHEVNAATTCTLNIYTHARVGGMFAINSSSILNAKTNFTFRINLYAKTLWRKDLNR